MPSVRICLISLLLCAVGCAARDNGTTVPPLRNSAIFARAAVAADHATASQAGALILRNGGNAVDAAVATSFALSVVRPYSCGIGGGGFMVIHFNNDPEHGSQTVSLNYREMCPSRVGPDYFEKLDEPEASRRGVHAAGVPGTVAGLLYALDHFGTLDRATVLAPAIRAAEEGFVVDDHYVGATRKLIEWFKEQPIRQERFRFVWDRFLRQGQVRVGDRIYLPEQANALRLIAEEGPSAFYRGAIALEILATMRRENGPMKAEDLLNYQVAQVEPLFFEAFGYTFVTAPPPSSGGVAIAQILGILDLRRRDLGRHVNSAAYIHLVTEALKHAFADRARWLADPAHADVPVETLISASYLRLRADQIDLSHTRDPDSYGTVPPDDHGTSHFSVVDAQGNAVACTETINLEFGSLVAVEKYGFVLNNEMDDFTTQRGKPNAFGLRQSDRNAPSPGKRPLSSMTPTIVLDDSNRVMLVVGGSGGPRIITATAQTILNVLLFDMPAAQAVGNPRFHHQWSPVELELQKSWYPAALQNGLVGQLEARGHTVRAAKSMAEIQLIRRARRARGWDAACDSDKGGQPAGF